MKATDVDCVGRDLVWHQSRCQAASDGSRPILFLDRDGVIVDEVNYLHRIEDVRLIDGAAETIRLARAAGWSVAIVSNQAGIGRGYYGWNEFSLVNDFILRTLDFRGGVIDAVFAVPHHKDGTGEYRHPNHPMRKPNPGMLMMAADILGGDLARSVIVGDNASDLMAGRNAGLLRGYHVLTGHGMHYRMESETLSSTTFEVKVIDDIGSVALRDYLISTHR